MLFRLFTDQKPESRSSARSIARSTSAPAPTAEATVTPEPYDSTEGGIHRYEYIVTDTTWNAAFADCIRRGGYLARINSREEYDYILGEISAKQMDRVIFFLGGKRESGDSTYYWSDTSGAVYGDPVNGPAYWCSSEWYANEPSYTGDGLDELYLDMFYKAESGRWFWNDVPDDIISVVPEYAGRVGYICEYEN